MIKRGGEMKHILLGVIIGGLLLGFIFCGDLLWANSTRIFEAQLETGNLSEFQNTSVSGSNVALDYDGSERWSGIGSMKATIAGVAGRAYAINKIPASSFLHIKMRIKPGYTTGAAAIRGFIRAFKIGSADAKFIVGFLGLGDYTNLRLATTLRDDRGAIVTASVVDTISNNSWHTIDILLTKSTDTTGVYTLWCDGELLFYRDTLDTDGGMPDSLIFGPNTGVGDGGAFYIDDIIVDTVFCGLPCGLVFTKEDDYSFYNFVLPQLIRF